jgi:hypothetical protein
MRLFREESGQTLILTATSLLVLMGFLALATDVGVLFHDRREMQTAADGAAAAAAVEMLDGGTSSQIVAAADNAATKNGFTDGSNGVTVTVHNPPTSGYHQTAGNVEVDITQASIPTVLMGLFGAKTVSVSARAVGSDAVAGAACGWLGNTTGTDMDIRGSGTIISPGCGWYVNSGSKSALNVTGNGNTVDAAYIGLVGGSAGSGTPQGTTVTAGVEPQPNPLLNQVTNGIPDGMPTGTPNGAPTASECTSSNTSSATSFNTSINASLSTYGGIYCFTNNVDISGATLSNGTFIFENGVTVANTATTNITNATLDLAGGAFNQIFNSKFLFNISSPAVDPNLDQWNNGIAIFVPPTNTTYTATACSANPNDTQELMIQFGSSTQTFSGYIYAPNATLTLHDQGGSVAATGIIAGALCDLSGTINITDYNLANPTTAPLRTVALVE